MIPPRLAALLAAHGARLSLIAAVIIVGLGLLQLRQCQRARTAATEQRLEDGLAGAARDSAQDTIRTVSDAAARDAASERTAKENADAIRQLPGANAPVDPAVAVAARRGLCRHAAYRDRPECVQQTAARGVANTR